MSLPHRYVAIGLLVLFATGLLPASVARAQARPEAGFVRLEPIESRAAPNEHPTQVSADLLRAALASIRQRGSLLTLGGTVFDDTELAYIAPSIAAAIGKASPSQDITFAVFGRHGPFGENSPATVTTGRVFVQAKQLNIILGLVQTRYEEVGFSGAVTLTPGLRARSIAPTSVMAAEPAKLVDKRGDWVLFDLTQAVSRPKPADPVNEPRPASAPAAVPPKSDAAEARYQDIQSRLKALDRLKTEGLITEDEYRERRRAILQAI